MTTQEQTTSTNSTGGRGRRTATLVAGVAALALVGGGAAVAATWPAASPQDVVVAQATVTADDAVTALTFNREEERMARDLYTLFADTYDDGPFAMIARSEQQHFASVGALLTTYGIDDPSAGLPAGEYADPAIQELYDTWKAQGLESFEAALQVGVDLEERDIADLEATLDEIDRADVQTVLSRLLAASQHHLRAFTAWVDGDQTGMGRGSGSGMGPGMGGNGFGGGWSGGMGGSGMGPGHRGAGGPGFGTDDDTTRGPGSGRGDCPFDPSDA
jgi:hypothetical protein